MRQKGKNKRWVTAIVVLCVAAVAVVFAVVRCGSAGGREKTMAFVQNLGSGWNLGNTLDAHEAGFYSDALEDYETLWMNPPASPDVFKAIRDAGFKSVRIPITWYPHMDGAHRVNEAWMRRVQQVVDSALDAGLYVIINAHHEAWYSPYPDSLERAVGGLTSLWGQVAAHFAQYDERLLFESMNEPRLIGEATEWTGGTPEAREGVNRLNQAFVHTVRAAGGKNARRFLLLPTYAAAIEEGVCAGFVLPQDARTIVSLHLYQPFAFTHEADGMAECDAIDTQDTRELEQVFGRINDYFTGRGIAVVITEFGAADKGNTPARLDWTRYVAERAAQSGIPCLWWDNGAGQKPGPLHTFALLDRRRLEWYFPEMARAVVQAYESDR